MASGWWVASYACSGRLMMAAERELAVERGKGGV